MSFNNKVVLVTGASSGIGAAIAIKFAHEGAKVVIIGRKQDKLKITAEKCGNPLVIAADVSKDDDCKRIVNETIAKFGKLDVLVNNAGVAYPAMITSENAMEVYDQVMSTNLRSTVYLTHLSAPHLIETKGNIVNMSSIGGIRVLSTGSFSYFVSKAGMDHFTRAAAFDLSSNGVRVNSVNPGPVKTDIVENSGYTPAHEEAIWKAMREMTALDRISEPEEVADLVLFLASDKAVAITGSTFTTDNGALLKGGLHK